MFKLLELNSAPNGQRRFVVSLCEIHPESCVVDGVGTQQNKNGITFLEKYCREQLDTIVGQSITAEFLNEQKTELYGHGDTGFAEDGFPKFENAESIGHFERAYIDDVEINGEMKRCVIGEGVIDEFRYQNTVAMLKEQIENGNTIHGSVELFAKDNNQSIIYENGWMEKGRIPKEFIFSGYALLSVEPADDAAVLLELNNKLEDEFQMDEAKFQELLDASVKTVLDKNAELENKVSEANSAKETAEADLETVKAEKASLETKVAELNTQIADKDQKIADLEKDIEAKNSELNEMHKAEKIAELNKMLENYDKAAREVAKTEINAFKEDPLNGDMDAIENKICRFIVKEMKTKTSETNSLMGEMDFVDDNEDNSIYA